MELLWRFAGDPGESTGKKNEFGWLFSIMSSFPVVVYEVQISILSKIISYKMGSFIW